MTAYPPSTRDYRELRSPLTDEMLRPSVSGRGIVQFNSLLTDAEFVRLAEWLSQYPQMHLRAYGSYDGSIRDLEFLRFFPFFRSTFAADALFNSLTSIEGLRHLSTDLEALIIGWTRHKLDLRVLARFSQLKTLLLEGQTRHIDTLSGLTSIEDLTLRSITLPDLSLLLPLARLLSLDIKLGGTKDLSLLPRIGDLRYLELWQIKGLDDISPIGGLSSLRSLFLQSLRRVTSLPNLAGCSALRRVDLQTMKGIHDLRPLATAPALEEVLLQEMRHLQPEDLRPLVGLPRLKAVTVGLGSKRKNDAAASLLGLPDVRGALDWREGVLGRSGERTPPGER